MSKLKKQQLAAHAKQAVNKYISKLLQEGLKVQAAYIYGSYAKGSFAEDSDIDVCIVSSDVSAGNEQDWVRLGRARWDVDLRLAPVGYSTDEFKNGWTPLVQEIKETGIRVR